MESFLWRILYIHIHVYIQVHAWTMTINNVYTMYMYSTACTAYMCTEEYAIHTHTHTVHVYSTSTRMPSRLSHIAMIWSLESALSLLFSRAPRAHSRIWCRPKLMLESENWRLLSEYRVMNSCRTERGESEGGRYRMRGREGKGEGTGWERQGRSRCRSTIGRERKGVRCSV